MEVQSEQLISRVRNWGEAGLQNRRQVAVEAMEGGEAAQGGCGGAQGPGLSLPLSTWETRQGQACESLPDAGGDLGNAGWLPSGAGLRSSPGWGPECPPPGSGRGIRGLHLHWGAWEERAVSEAGTYCPFPSTHQQFPGRDHGSGQEAHRARLQVSHQQPSIFTLLMAPEGPPPVPLPNLAHHTGLSTLTPPGSLAGRVTAPILWMSPPEARERGPRSPAHPPPGGLFPLNEKGCPSASHGGPSPSPVPAWHCTGSQFPNASHWGT